MACKFVLEITDEGTNCISEIVNFAVPEIDLVNRVLGIAEFLPGASYPVSHAQILSLKNSFALEILIESDYSGFLRQANWLDDLPYRVHTNSELLLMVRGSKPFACFAEPYPTNGSVIPERQFEQHPVARYFTKRSHIQGQTRYVMYSLNDHEWRIDAFIVMVQSAEITGWNEGFEWMEGLLLGYEEWQNHAFALARKERASRLPTEIKE